jgi:hypothetical protein
MRKRHAKCERTKKEKETNGVENVGDRNEKHVCKIAASAWWQN